MAEVAAQPSSSICVGPKGLYLRTESGTTIISGDGHVIGHGDLRMINPVLYKDECYFINSENNHSIDVVDDTLEDVRTIVQGPVENMFIYRDELYYIQTTKGHLMAKSLDEGKPVELCKEVVQASLALEGKCWLITKDGLSLIDLETGIHKHMHSGHYIKMTAIDHRLVLWTKEAPLKPVIYDQGQVEAMSIAPVTLVGHNESFYYIDGQDFCTVYKWQAQGDKGTRIYGKSCSELYCNDQELYMCTEAGWYCMNLLTFETHPIPRKD